MEELYGIRELYEVFLKATYPMDIGNKHIEKGEVILSFDNIQVGGFQELKNRVSATGGFDNREHVSWENTKELPLSFTQGVFSQLQYSIITNSKLFDIGKNKPIEIFKREILETDENGFVELKYKPIGTPFCYNKQTNEKMLIEINDKLVNAYAPYQDVVIDYTYEYTNGGKVISIGNRLLNGYLMLEAKTRLKDDVTGHTVTGIIKIPKLKLMSDLSIRLGRGVDPAMVSFNAIGVPVGERGATYVCDLISLNDDIDSDF